MGIKISQLPLLTTLQTSDVIPIVDQVTQGTKRVTLQTLNTFAASSLSAVARTGSYSDLLNVPEMFTLVPATANTLGGVKIGANLQVASDGTISATPGFQQINVGAVALTQTTSALSFFAGGGMTLTADPVANSITFSSSGGGGGGGSGNVGYGAVGTLPVYFNTTTITGTNITFDGTTLGLAGNINVGGIIATEITATTITSTGDVTLNPAGNVSVANKRIINVGTPQNSGDAVSKSYVDGQRAFGKIIVGGQSLVTANSNTDAITFLAGNNVQISTNAGARSVTIAVNNTLSFALLPASTSSIGGIIVGSGLSIDSNGILSSTAIASINTATTTTAGTVIIGSGLAISAAGTLTALAQVLGTATSTTLGGVKIGPGIIVTNDGTIEVPSQTLSTATSFLLGGVKIGQGIAAAVDGTISVSSNGLPFATSSSTGVVRPGYGLSVDSTGTLNLGVNGNFTITGNLAVNGVISATNIYTTGSNLSIISSSNDLQLSAVGQVTATSPVQITTATASTSPATGSLIVGIYGTNSAGVGVAGALYTGLDGNFNGVTFGAGGGSQPNNVAAGSGALSGNLTGRYITAIGANALKLVQQNDNVGVGYSAGIAVTNGGQNTLLGNYAGSLLQTGQTNVAIGYQTQVGIGNASNNVNIGGTQLNNVTNNPNNNVYIGYNIQNSVGSAGSNSVVIGSGALGNATGTNLVMIGYGAGSALTSASNQVIIGGYSGSAIPSKAFNGYVTISDGAGVIKAQWTGAGLLTQSGAMTITNATVSADIYSGALVVAGGVGIQGTLNANAINSPSISVGGSPVVTFANLGSSVSTVAGGTDITVSTQTGNVIINDASTLQTVTLRGSTSSAVMTLTNNASANSSITGALQVFGGIGVQGQIYAHGSIYTDNVVYSGGSPVLSNINWTGNYIGIGSTSSQGVYYATLTNAGVQTITIGSAIINGGGGIPGLLVSGNAGGTVVQQAGSWIPGQLYTVVSLGNTVWNTWGASVPSPTIGSTFYATGVGSGTGVASYQQGTTGTVTLTSIETIDTVAHRMMVDSGVSMISSIAQLTMTNVLTILNSATSTGTSYGALTVAGGVGIGQNLYVGGQILVNGVPLSTSTTFNGGTITGKIYVQNTSTSTVTKTNNAISTDGGIWASYFYLNGYPLSTSTVWSGGSVSGTVNITNVAPAVSTSSAALTVTGGIGTQNYVIAKGYKDQAGRPIGQGPTFSAINSSTQTITSGVWTKLQWPSLNWDTDAAFDSTTNYRFTPAQPGYYQVEAGVRVPTTASATGISQLAIYKNGGLWRAGNTWPNSTTNPGELHMSAIVDLQIAASDYIEIWFYQNSTANMTLPNPSFGPGQTGSTTTYFQSVYIRPFTIGPQNY